MGIRIELTDENLPEIGAEYEISDEEVEEIMKNPPAECREIEDKILWFISSREDGGIEVWPGSKGCIVLRSEAEAEWLCERIIRSIRNAPSEQAPEPLYEERIHDFVLDDEQDSNMTDEERRKWSFCPIVAKDDSGNVSMFAPGSDVIRFKNKEAAKATMDALMQSFDKTE